MGDSVDMSRHWEPQTPISHQTLSHAPGARRAASVPAVVRCVLWLSSAGAAPAAYRLGGVLVLWACFRYRYGPWLVFAGCCLQPLLGAPLCP